MSEYNVTGASICAVSARDPGCGQNALVSCSLLEDRIQGMPASSYVSVSADGGSVYISSGGSSSA